MKFLLENFFEVFYFIDFLFRAWKIEKIFNFFLVLTVNQIDDFTGANKAVNVLQKMISVLQEVIYIANGGHPRCTGYGKSLE